MKLCTILYDMHLNVVGSNGQLPSHNYTVHSLAPNDTTHFLLPSPLLQAMMDRQKEDELPRMQVGFIDGICLPLYKELYELHPPFKPLYDGVLNNRDMWQALADEKEAGKAECTAAAASVC